MSNHGRNASRVTKALAWLLSLMLVLTALPSAALAEALAGDEPTAPVVDVIEEPIVPAEETPAEDPAPPVEEDPASVVEEPVPEPAEEPTPEEPTEEPVPEPVTEPVLESKDELETKMQTVAGQYRYRVSEVHFVEDAAKNYTLSADQLDGENGYRFYKTAKVTFDFIRSDWTEYPVPAATPNYNAEGQIIGYTPSERTVNVGLDNGTNGQETLSNASTTAVTVGRWSTWYSDVPADGQAIWNEALFLPTSDEPHIARLVLTDVDGAEPAIGGEGSWVDMIVYAEGATTVHARQYLNNDYTGLAGDMDVTVVVDDAVNELQSIDFTPDQEGDEQIVVNLDLQDAEPDVPALTRVYFDVLYAGSVNFDVVTVTANIPDTGIATVSTPVRVASGNELDTKGNADAETEAVPNSATYYVDVTGVNVGTTKMIVQAAYDGKTVSGQMTVKVIGGHATGIAFDAATSKQTKEIDVGGTIFNAIAKITPEKADQNILYTSSNPEIATVDEQGVVRGIAYGEAKITATAEENPDLSDYYIVKVNDVTIIDGNPQIVPSLATIELYKGVPMDVTFTGHSLTDVDTTSKATVTLANGNVTAAAQDVTVNVDNSVTIPVTVTGETVGFDTMTVQMGVASISVPVIVFENPIDFLSGLTIDPAYSEMKPGDTLKLSLSKALPYGYAIEWVYNVVTPVDRIAQPLKTETTVMAGKVDADTEAGVMAVITFPSLNGEEPEETVLNAAILIKAVPTELYFEQFGPTPAPSPNPPPEIKKEVTIDMGEIIYDNPARVLPADADQAVTYTSENPDIATVDASGVVRGIAFGQTVIHAASVEDPQITDSYIVNVIDVVAIEGPVYSAVDVLEIFKGQTAVATFKATGPVNENTAISATPVEGNVSAVVGDWSPNEDDPAVTDIPIEITGTKVGFDTVQVRVGQAVANVQVIVYENTAEFLTGLALDPAHSEMKPGDTLKVALNKALPYGYMIDWQFNDVTDTNPTMMPFRTDVTVLAGNVDANTEATVVAVIGIPGGEGDPDITEVPLTASILIKAVPATVQFAEDEKTIEIGQIIYDNPASVLPADADQSVTYTSENPEIATVDASGVVRGIAFGQTVIHAASVEDPQLTDSYIVNVVDVIAIEGPVYSDVDVLEIYKGQTAMATFHTTDPVNENTAISATPVEGNVSAVVDDWSPNADDLAVTDLPVEITGLEVGFDTVQVRVGQAVATIQVIVYENPADYFNGIALLPAVASIDVDETQQYALNKQLPYGYTADWAVADAAVAALIANTVTELSSTADIVALDYGTTDVSVAIASPATTTVAAVPPQTLTARLIVEKTGSTMIQANIGNMLTMAPIIETGKTEFRMQLANGMFTMLVWQNGQYEPVPDAVFSFASSDEELFTVEGNELIARETGTGTLTVTGYSEALDMSATLDLPVRVRTEVQDFALSETEITLGSGESKVIYATPIPADAVNAAGFALDAIAFADPAIAKMTNRSAAYFTITAADITADAQTTVTVNGVGKAKEVTVNVVSKPSDINNDPDDRNVEMFVGDDILLNYELTPAGTDTSEIVWTNSDENVVRHLGEGRIVAVGEGYAEVTASIPRLNKTIHWFITVVQLPEKLINTMEIITDVFVGETIKVPADIYPEGAQDGFISYELAVETANATVTDDGIFTATKAGVYDVSISLNLLMDDVLVDQKTTRVIVEDKPGYIETGCLYNLNTGDQVVVDIDNTHVYAVPTQPMDELLAQYDAVTHGAITGVYSCNASVASVTGEAIMAESEGFAKAYIQTEKGYRFYFTLRVSQKLEDIALSTQNVNLEVGDSAIVITDPIPDQETTNRWTTLMYEIAEGDDVAAITNDGVITAVAEGTAYAKVTATYVNLDQQANMPDEAAPEQIVIIKYVTINVAAKSIDVTSIVIDPFTDSVEVNQWTPAIVDNVQYLPAGANVDTSVTFTSSDPTVAYIDPLTGSIQGIKKGMVLITATTPNGTAVSYPFTVLQGDPTALEAETYIVNLKGGETMSVRTFLTPTNAEMIGWKWIDPASSSDRIAIAEANDADDSIVDIIGINPGVAYVTASATNDMETLSCTIKVIVSDEPIFILPLNSINLELGEEDDMLRQTENTNEYFYFLVEPEDTDVSQITFASQNSGIVAVEGSKLIAKGVGKTFITATLPNGQKATWVANVFVTPTALINVPESILTFTHLDVKIPATISPEGAEGCIRYDVSKYNPDGTVDPVDLTDTSIIATTGIFRSDVPGDFLVNVSLFPDDIIEEDEQPIAVKEVKVKVEERADYIVTNVAYYINTGDMIAFDFSNVEDEDVLGGYDVATHGILTDLVSCDPTVASVTEETVYGLSEGETMVYIETDKGYRFYFRVDVAQRLESIAVSPTEMTLVEGEQGVINTTLYPANVTTENLTTVTYASSDPAVATVADGIVTAVAPGTTQVTVTATYENPAKKDVHELNTKEDVPADTYTVEKIVTVVVTPKPVPVTEIEFDTEAARITMLKGTYLNLPGVTVTPEDADDKSITYYSTNSDIVSVEDAAIGTVYGVEVGEAEVIVETVNGLKASIIVEVIDIANGVFFNEGNVALYPGETVDMPFTIVPEGMTYTDAAVTKIAVCGPNADENDIEYIDGKLYAHTSALPGSQYELTVSVTVPAYDDMGALVETKAYTDTALVTILAPVTSLTLTDMLGNEIQPMEEGGAKEITGTVGTSVIIGADLKSETKYTVDGTEKTVTMPPSDTRIDWHVSDSNVAVIEPIYVEGVETNLAKLTFVAKGTATVTATARQNELVRDDVVVKTADRLNDFTMTPDHFVVYPMEQFDLTYVMDPADTILVDKVKFTANPVTVPGADTTPDTEKNIVAVDENGHVLALLPGHTTITVTYFNGVDTYTRTVVVDVKNPVATITAATPVDMNVGEQYDAAATVVLTGMDEDMAISDESLTWSVKDGDIVSVDENGIITALNVGKTFVYATAHNGLKAQIEVNVTSVASDLFLDTYAVDMWAKDVKVVRATLTPADSTDAVEWFIDKEDVAAITNYTQTAKSVQVTALKAGAAKLYAYVPSTLKPDVVVPDVLTAEFIEENYGLFEICYINVLTPVTDIEIGKEDGITRYEDDDIIEAPEGDTLNVSAIFGHFETIEGVKTFVVDEPDDRGIIWTVADPTIAKVEEVEGNENMATLTFLKKGVTTLYLRSEQNAYAYDQITIKVGPNVTNFTIDPTYTEVYPGEGFTYKVVLQPADAMLADKITWTSSAEDVATVDRYGYLTPIKAGTATITAVYSDSITTKTFTRTATVVVKQPVESLVFNPAELTKYVGEYEDLFELLVWNNDESVPADKSIRWTIEDKSIVSVTAEGTLKALKVGETDVYAYAYNDIYAKIHVTVLQNAEKLILDAYNVSIWPGEQATVNATVFPELATDTFEWKLKDSEEFISEVNSETAQGDRWITIEGLKPGKTTFNAIVTVAGATETDTPVTITKTVYVTVKTPATVIEVDSVYPIAVGETYPKTVTANYIGQNVWLYANLYNMTVDAKTLASDQSVVWESMDPTIATVDANGKMTAVRAGHTVIKATSVSNPEVWGTINVTVIKDHVQLEVDPSDMTLRPGETGTVIGMITKDGTEIADYSEIPDNIEFTIENVNPLDPTATDVISIRTVKVGGKYQCVVTGVNPGTATVTATIYGDIPEYTQTATCEVTVINPVVTIDTAKKYLTMLVGEKFSYDMTKDLIFTSLVDGELPTNTDVKYVISDETILKADDYGRLVALQVGETQVDVVSLDDESKKVTIYVEVVDIPGGIYVDAKEIMVYPGDEVLVNVLSMPDGAVYKDVVWTYEDYDENEIDTAEGESYAKFKWDYVNEDGVIQAVSPTTELKGGYITMIATMNIDEEVRATYDDNWNYDGKYFPEAVSTKVRVYVLQPVEGVVIDNIHPDVANEVDVLAHEDSLAMNVGDQYILQATVLPNGEAIVDAIDSPNAVDKELIWTSSDPSVASVDPFGIVTAHSAGTVKIYATSKQNTSCQDYVTIDVVNADPILIGRTIICDAIIRATPATNGIALYRVKRGSTVTIYGIIGDEWYVIDGGTKSETGFAYIPMYYVKVVSETTTDPVVTDPNAITITYNAVTIEKANIYNTDPRGTVRAYTVPAGTKLMIVGSDKENFYVEFGYDIGMDEETDPLLTGRIARTSVSRMAGYDDGEGITITYLSPNGASADSSNAIIIDPGTGAQIETGVGDEISIPATVTATSAPVYSSYADAPGTIMGRLYQGAQVTIVSEKYLGYYQIQLANGTVCWINQIYIAKNSGENQVVETKIETIVMAKVGSKVNLRAAASSTSKKLGTVSKGAYVKITGAKRNGFYPVETASGMTGYISARYLKLFEQEVSVDVVTSTPQAYGSVNCRILNVRNQPSMNATIVGTLHNSYYYNDYFGSTGKYEADTVQIVYAVEDADGNAEWYHIIMPDDSYAYVKAEYLNVYYK